MFDLDGVIVDTRAIVRSNWERFTALHGLAFPIDDLDRIYGRRTVDILVDVFGIEPAEARRMARAWVVSRAGEIAALESLPVVRGAAAFVRAARAAGIPIALASSAIAGNVEAALRLAGLEDSFGAVVTAEGVERGKPAPDAYLRAASLLGVAAGSCVVFEDTPAGIAAGHAAGAQVVAVATTFGRAALRAADLVIDDFVGLEPLDLAGALPRGRR